MVDQMQKPDAIIPDAAMQAPFYDDESVEEEESLIGEYEIITTPNDFNIKTLFDFIDSGVITIPEFQRNYVWDIKRASKLIESIIIGLPVPQIFLYEEGRNKFLVIDGQQRLLSIYYFIKQRFPRKDKRTELRRIFDLQGRMPPETLHDDKYFTNFNLVLPGKLPNQQNKFNGLNYSTLDEYRTTFDLRTLRNVVIRLVHPKNDNSAIFEIFHRLNTGGVNLSAQEIRMSLYHSDFYVMLSRINTRPEWRRLIGLAEPDLYMKDLEFLLRGFSMLIKGESYKPSMAKFLNGFSMDARSFTQQQVSYLESLFDSFLKSCTDLSSNSFESAGGRFGITVFESIFVAVCHEPYAEGQLVGGNIDPDSVKQLKRDLAFLDAAQQGTSSKINVSKRLERAQAIIQVSVPA